MYKRGTKSAQVNVESVRGHLSIVFHERCKQVSRQWEQSVELEGDRERIHMEEDPHGRGAGCLWDIVQQRILRLRACVVQSASPGAAEQSLADGNCNGVWSPGKI